MEIPNWSKWLFGVVAFIAATVLLLWLAGFFFFLFSKANPFGKTDFWTWWTYWQYYQDNLVIAKRLKISAIAAAVLAYGGPLALIINLMREVRALHGEARFANAYEIKKAGLNGSTGIIIGKIKNRFLMFPGMQFVLLAAPTRSGKGVGIVIPNLLNWSESVVVLDVKLENFLITSKFRAQWGQEIYLFNPFSITEDGEGNPLEGKTHRYNPLGYISDNTRLRVTDILAIGYSLYPGEGRDAFFDDAARNLFLGLTLYLCETPSLPRTMGELLRQSSGKGRPVKDHILNIIKERNYRELGDVMLNEVGEDRQKVVQAIVAATLIDKDKAETLCAQAPILIAKDVPEATIEHVEAVLKGAGAQIETTHKSLPMAQWDSIGLPPLSMECVDALSRFTSTSDNTLSSIMASFNVPITIWASPIVDAATSTNDFDLRDIRKKLISIYIGIPANKLAEAKLLMNMFYTQLINLNTSRLLHSTPELRYTCLMLDDEFTAPGRIGIIDKANSYMAGYGLRMLNIIQSPGQLEADAPKGYGRENARTLVTNHACQIFFTPRDLRDANEYSEALGFYTFKAKGNSRQLGGKADGSRSESESDQKRALMMPQELKEMSQREQIVSLENTKAIRCEKIHYYSDPIFMDRLKSVSKTLANLGRGLPTKKQLESVWGSGELSVSIPLLNLDLHEAIVQERSRELKANEVTKGIDLNTLAIDFSKIPYLSGDGIETTEVEAFVNGFFDALDLVNEYEELGTAVIEKPAFDIDPTSEVLPKNGMHAANFQDEEPITYTEAESPVPSLIPVLASASLLTETVKAVTENEQGLDVADIEPAEASDEELAKMMDDFSFCADEIMDEAEMLAALDKTEEVPEYINDLQNRPIIDLSLLNKAFPPPKDSITGQL